MLSEQVRQLLASAPRRCAACDVEILWLCHERTMKPAPIEAKPIDDGNVLLLRAETLKCRYCERFFAKFRCNAPEECDCPPCQGMCECHRAQLLPALEVADAFFYRIRKREEVYDAQRDGLRYRSHFVSCPHAPHFRDHK